MLVTWRYKPRKSLIQSFDPRAWLIFYACFLASTVLFWDLRYLAALLLITLITILTSGIKCNEMKRAWIFIIGFVIFFSLLTFLTGRGGIELYSSEHVISRTGGQFHNFWLAPDTDHQRRENHVCLEHAGARLQSGQHDHPHPVFAQPGPLRHHLPRSGAAG